MSFLRKVYYNDKAIILTTDCGKYQALGNTDVILYGATEHNFFLAAQHLDKPRVKSVVIEDASQDALMHTLEETYKPVDAGGGIVYNEDNAVLMIFRRGKWDLPKGKLDEGESLSECALREVNEETGLQHLQLGEKVGITYHIYTQHGHQLLKRSTWYKMKGTIKDKLMPQQEEQIMEARWVMEKDMAPVAEKAYEAIKEVLHKAGLTW